MSAQDILDMMNQIRHNHGLKLRDVEYFLNNKANLRVIEGMSLEEVARHIFAVYLDSASGIY